jgi:hypothetical protein
MGTNAVAYGLIPVYHPSGQVRANLYTILNNAGTGYGTAIYKGDPVRLGTNGTIEIGGGAATTNLGVFAGCEYVDTTGKPVVSAYWPASTAVLAGSVIKAYVYDDPAIVYKVSTAGGTPSGYVQTAVGGQADVTVAAGSVNTGISASYLAAVQAGALGNVRIVGFLNNEIYNATTNPYPEVLVTFAEVQFAPNAVGLGD